MSTAAGSGTYPLFRLFPALEKSLPRISLSPGPSPVSRLERLSQETDVEVWIKNDGLYGTIYGGNKPRKLELLLPRALETGARTVVTTGPLGTHHGLATALYGRPLGLQVVLLLTYQRPNAHVVRQLFRMARAGARMHYVSSGPRLALSLPWHLARYAFMDSGRRPYVLPPGGSTPLGVLGYVNAGLELAQQVSAGELPEPEALVLPVGSGGTAAGLALGLALASLKTRVIGVSVIRAPTTWAPAVRRLAMEAAALLRRHGADPGDVFLPDIRVHGDWIGGGYGRETREGVEAQRLLAQDGVQLDPTYTAKAVAGLAAICRRGAWGKGPVLYWHTYDALLASDESLNTAEAESLPRPFRRFCPGTDMSGKARPSDGYAAGQNPHARPSDTER